MPARQVAGERGQGHVKKGQGLGREAASLHVRDEDTSSVPTLLFYKYFIVVGSSCWHTFLHFLGHWFAVGTVIVVSRTVEVEHWCCSWRWTFVHSADDGATEFRLSQKALLRLGIAHDGRQASYNRRPL